MTTAVQTTEHDIVLREERNLTAAEIKAQVQLIQQVMHAVMTNGTHYGLIPGCGDRPALFKPGAEKLSATFRFAIDPQVEDLSTEDHCRFRVRAAVTHQVGGQFLGAGIGEASGQEIKYYWRKAVCQEEWDATAETHRQIKWGKGEKGAIYTVAQVRTNQADVANTVLKMAKKRALVDAVLTITGASDCFAQDIEDMDESVRQEQQQGGDAPAAAATTAKTDKAETSVGECISDLQARRAFAIGKENGFTPEQYRALVKKHAGVTDDRKIPKAPKSLYENLVAELQAGSKAGNVPAGFAQ